MNDNILLGPRRQPLLRTAKKNTASSHRRRPYRMNADQHKRYVAIKKQLRELLLEVRRNK